MKITQYTTVVERDSYRTKVLKVKESTYIKSRLNSPGEISEMMNEIFHLNQVAEEYAYIIAFTSDFKTIGVFEVGHGTAMQCLIGVREIFVRLFLVGAVNFVLVHNHPSGSKEPSREDINITQRIYQASQLMGIVFADHIIVCGDRYVSLKEQGLME